MLGDTNLSTCVSVFPVGHQAEGILTRCLFRGLVRLLRLPEPPLDCITLGPYEGFASCISCNFRLMSRDTASRTAIVNSCCERCLFVIIASVKYCVGIRAKCSCWP